MEQAEAVNNYPIGGQEHLQRALKLLKGGSVAELLYAALELRLGTEARQAQYARNWDHIPKRYRESYRTTEVGKALEAAFNVGDDVVIITEQWANGRSFEFMFTPVSRELRQVCEQLGNFLHFPGWWKAYPDNAVEWQKRLRELVALGVVHLMLATKGELLGPAMRGDHPGKITVKMEVGRARLEEMEEYRPRDESLVLQVRMRSFNEMAKEIRCELAKDFPQYYS